MALAQWLTATAVATGSGLLASAPAPQDQAEPPRGTPISDPDRPPPPSGLGHEPQVWHALDSPTVLFVNFDGPFLNGGCGNDSHQDCSILYPNTQFEPSPASPSKRAAVIQAVRQDVLDFGVIVVGERPPSSNPYAMVVVGTPEGGAPGGIGGVAPIIDCGNTNPNITSFSFLVNASSNAQATVIHQEAAHTWGLEHVNDESDNLFPSVGGVTDPQYQDTCSQVVADTMLTPTGAFCNAVHTMFCPPDQQNSYQEMLLLFGPPIPDDVPPGVTIDAPTEGQVIEYADDFDLTITLDDDRRPQLIDTTVSFDGQEAASITLFDSTHTFPVNGGDPPGGHGLSNGLHTIRVDVTDEAGNPASAEVTIEIVSSPFGNPGDSGDVVGEASDGTGGTAPMGPGTTPALGGDDASDEGCSCRTTRGEPPPWLGVPLLLLLGARRRRR
ncbi:MAG: hypothetical protein KDK70_17505 [Myxococcales bacterium]|nr:hypothetical protein [Myxococcales bacterium]